MTSDTLNTPNAAGCQRCGSPTGDDGGLCRTCTFKLSADLREVPTYLWAELQITITRQDKLMPTSDRPGGEKPMVWNENGSQVAWELQTTLNAWALDVSRLGQDERDLLADVAHHDVPELARWLVRNMHTLRMLGDAGQCFEEIVDAIRRGRRAIDRPENRTRFQVGPCPEQANEGACDGEVWAFIPTSEDKISFMRCQACGAEWDTTQWLRVGRRMLARIHQLRSA